MSETRQTGIPFSCIGYFIVSKVDENMEKLIMESIK
jgi:hypothetical protein